ncbi:hypothetical protein GCM10010112_00210 [Actinoplanes lobatus]|uniref:Uncharacterized protein n=1 Tax=Actinoplanes lobatus TaxID=113568 RepID=A0A7W7H9E9_9ACTN|nr:hypothetical protein [Actinoplanes lobatus]MBB4746440.1 hypothetical protein [Actinoplanes lobatus]GGN52456.1 hypothetical protein GCM10010112_00210 [Actinoplanes lobatus]GIE45634.1 hypothetical protein Alo02nite_85320 [Actinoplanes lobatus]
MSMFGKLADRLLAMVAPTTEAEAACVLISTVRTPAGYCAGADGVVRYKITRNYDSCAPKVTYSCTGK